MWVAWSQSPFYSAPAIIFNMDTATTMVVVDKDVCFRGGANLPGVKLDYQSSILPEIGSVVLGSFHLIPCLIAGGESSVLGLPPTAALLSS